MSEIDWERRKESAAPLNFRGRHNCLRSKYHSARKEAAAPLPMRDVVGWGEQGANRGLHIGFQKRCSRTVVREECFFLMS